MAGSSPRLIMKDLKDVLEAVVLMGGKKWKRLGIQLEVKYERLETIQQNHPSVDDCLLEVLKEWLRGSSPPPTWEWLAEAMKSKTVDEPGLSEEIFRDWIKPMQAKAKKRIRKLARRMPRKPLPKPAREARPRRKRRPRPKAIIEYLRQLTPPPTPLPLTPRVGPLLAPALNQSFRDPSLGFPHMASAALSKDERNSLEYRLFRETSAVEKVFEVLVRSTVASFNRRVTPNHLANVFMQFQAADAFSDHEPLQVSIRCENELRSASSIEKAFTVLLEYISFFNCDLLKALIQQYGSERDEESLAQYNEIIAQFSRRRLCESPIATYGNEAEDDTQIRVTMAHVFDFYTLKDVTLFQRNLCEMLRLSPHALRFIAVSERGGGGGGGLELVFVLPLSLAGAFRRLTAGDLEWFEREGVLAIASKAFRYDFRKVLQLSQLEESADLTSTSEAAVAKQPPEPEEEFYRAELEGCVWSLPVCYREPRPTIGSGGEPMCSVLDVRSGSRLAVRKLSRPALTTSSLAAKGAFRELALLSHLRHENIASLLDVFTPPATDQGSFNELYFVSAHLGSTLDRVISRRALSDKEVQCVVAQILSGLKYAHSAGVVHGSLQPSCIAINEEDLSLQIRGFGKWRASYESQAPPTFPWTAPELLLDWRQWGTPADLWSLGCITAQLLRSEAQPLCPGQDRIDQLAAITQLLGSPRHTFLSSVNSQPARNFVATMPQYSEAVFSRQFPGASDGAVDLVSKLLVLDPGLRLTAEEALAHPYLATAQPGGAPGDEVGHMTLPVASAAAALPQGYERMEATAEEWTKLLYGAVQSFHRPHLS